MYLPHIILQIKRVLSDLFLLSEYKNRGKLMHFAQLSSVYTTIQFMDRVPLDISVT